MACKSLRRLHTEILISLATDTASITPLACLILAVVESRQVLLPHRRRQPRDMAGGAPQGQGTKRPSGRRGGGVRLRRRRFPGRPSRQDLPGSAHPWNGTLYRGSPSTTTLLSATTFRGLCSSSRYNPKSPAC